MSYTTTTNMLGSLTTSIPTPNFDSLFTGSSFTSPLTFPTVQVNTSGLTFTYSKENSMSFHAQTRTQTLIDGYVGQVLINGVVVWQGRKRKTEYKAEQQAKRHYAKRLEEMFA